MVKIQNCFVLGLFLISFSFLGLGAEEKIFNQANRLYQEGMQATSLLERQKAFNQALRLYLDLQMQSNSFELYRATADTFYQLGQYPESILYNYRALKIQPANEAAKHYIQQAQKNLLLPSAIKESFLQRILSFNDLLGLSQRLQLFFWIFLIGFLVISLAIWLPSSLLRKISFLSHIAIGLMLINLVLSFYILPVEAILITSTGFYRESDFNYPQIQAEPLQEGTKVTVLNYKDKWLKIKNSEEVVGYVPLSSVRLI